MDSGVTTAAGWHLNCPSPWAKGDVVRRHSPAPAGNPELWSETRLERAYQKRIENKNRT